jgi:hypothetical protein
MSQDTFPTGARVKVYAGVTDTTGAPCTLGDFIQMKADSYRTGWEKKKLPAITVGGQFANRRAASLITPSGLVQVDFDDSANPRTDWATVRDSLGQRFEALGLPAFVALSASGWGVYALVYRPHLIGVYEREGVEGYLSAHAEESATITDEAETFTGLVADRSVTKRANGLRFISADPCPYISGDFGGVGALGHSVNEAGELARVIQ